MDTSVNSYRFTLLNATEMITTTTAKQLEQKSILVNKIMAAVNVQAVAKGTKAADGDMFLSLIFMSVRELKGICKKARI